MAENKTVGTVMADSTTISTAIENTKTTKTAITDSKTDKQLVASLNEIDSAFRKNILTTTEELATDQ